MDMHEYAFLLDTVYRTWGRYETMCLLYEYRVANGEPEFEAPLALVRTHRDRAHGDLTTLRAQALEVSFGPVPLSASATESMSKTSRTRAENRLVFLGSSRQFAVSGPGALDASI